MIYDATTSVVRRDKVIEFIKGSGFKRVVDVGGVLGPWAREVVTHYVDILDPQVLLNAYPECCDSDFMEACFYSRVDISNPNTWGKVMEYVKAKGKFDFAICSQTLEHVAIPDNALRFLESIAGEGFIAVPNKKTELTRGIQFTEEGLSRCGVRKSSQSEGSPWRGFLPHRWICTLRDDAMFFFPKLNFLEYLDGIDEWIEGGASAPELSFFWKNNIPSVVIDDGFIDHPDPQKACEFFAEELRKGM